MPKKTNINNKPPIGILIATTLEEKGKTQKWLAKKTGLSIDWIWCIVSGRNIPSFRAIKKISVALKLNFSDMVRVLFEDE